MSFLPDIFQDPVLVTRQAQLDAQWKSLSGIVTQCDNVPTSTWVEFSNDFREWQAFYASGSNWTQASKTATDLWQDKLQDYTKRVVSYGGCGGSLGSVDGVTIVSAMGDGGIPTVKNPPPNDPDFIDTALATVNKVTQPARDAVSTIGWVAVGLAVIVIVAIVYILTRGKASGYGVKIGD